MVNIVLLVYLGSQVLTLHKQLHLQKDEQLTLSATDRLSEDEHKKVDKFLTIFFTNYTTNQDNLNLIAKDVSVVANTTFKSIDYTYLKEDGEKLIATVQVTF